MSTTKAVDTTKETPPSLAKGERLSYIPSRLDRLPLGNYHYTLTILSFLMILFDGMDTTLIGLAMPLIGKEFSFTKMELGGIASAGLAAIFFGALIVSSIADEKGRKPTIMWTVAMYSVFSATTGAAWNMASFYVTRFVTGFGLGAGLPLGGTIVNELIPTKWRARVAGLAVSGFAWGWVASALMGMYVMTTIGWRWAFFLTAIPALLVLAFAYKVHESPRWLEIKGRTEEANKIVAQLEREAGLPPIKEDELKPETIVAAKHTPIKTIFTRDYRSRTFMIFSNFAVSLYAVYGFGVWLPSQLVASGHSIAKSFTYTLIVYLGGAIGQSLSGFIMDWLGRRRALIFNWTISIVAMMLLAFTPELVPWQIMLFGFFGTFGLFGNQIGMNVYCGELYPTRVRATAVGWTNAFGRIGAMLGPIISAYVLTMTSDTRIFYGIFVGCILYMIINTLILGPETRGKVLEKLSH
jgi:MFS transporter, putative metabolite:H+ symporter